MHSVWVRSVVLTSCTCLAACTTLTPVRLGKANAEANDARSELAGLAGQTVVIRTTSGMEFVARLQAANEGSVELIREDAGEKVVISEGEIASISRKEFSGGRTVLLLAGGVLVAYLVAYVAFIGKVLGGGW
jgi:hypothetical protein